MSQEPHLFAHEKAFREEKGYQTRCHIFKSLQKLQKKRNDTEELPLLIGLQNGIFNCM
uniref:Uncharacterized protein n=1 Tax=viral metagenome TaxID=1070528 RepID=A0A6C0B158_9ZZZZ